MLALLVASNFIWVRATPMLDLAPLTTYPLTVTPIPTSEWVFAGLTNQEIVEAVIAGHKNQGWMADDPTVLQIIEIDADDASELGVSEAAVLHGSVPDIAVVLSGQFYPPFDKFPDLQPYAYMVIVVDRASGWSYLHRASHNLQDLLAPLP
jgi:hypothetical protein